MSLLSIRHLLSWVRKYPAVAAVCTAGIVAAGFLLDNITDDLLTDGNDQPPTVESRSASPDEDVLGFSVLDASDRLAERSSSPNQGTPTPSAAKGRFGIGSISLRDGSPDYLEFYVPGDAGPRGQAMTQVDSHGGASTVSTNESHHGAEEVEVGDDLDLDEGRDEDNYPRNATIAGRVIDESGMALIGIGLTATAIHLFDVPPGMAVPVEDLQRRAVSDTAGHYRFDRLAAGEYRVNNVPNAGYGMTQISVRSGVDFADLVLKSQRDLYVSGTVTDATGQPLAGALVQPQFIGGRGAYTDSAGRFQLQMQVQEKAKGLGIRAALYGYREKVIVVDARNLSAGLSAPISIKLEPIEKHTVVSGLLRSAADGSPVPGKAVQLFSAENQQRYDARSNAEGRFQMIAVEANRVYEVVVAGGGGFATYLLPNVAISEKGLELDLLLEEDDNRELIGRMVNLNGVPIPNFSLAVRSASAPSQTMRVTSDAAGNFVVRNPPGSSLVFESQSMPKMQIRGVQVPTTPGQAIVLTLDVGRDEIHGLIVDTNGDPIAVPNVVASWRHVHYGISSSSTRRAAADAQGGISFRNLGPGLHTITVDATGYKPVRVEHDVASDGYEFTIRLEPITSGS